MAPIKNSIQRLRLLKDMDQQTLADHLGVTRTYLSKLENQKFTPGPDLMARICSFFSKELGEVFFIRNPESEVRSCQTKR